MDNLWAINDKFFAEAQQAEASRVAPRSG